MDPRVLWSLSPFGTKGRFVRAAFKQAWRQRDEPLEEITEREVLELIDKALPPLRGRIAPGLPRRMALIDEPSTGVPAIDIATEAARGGDWKPAAELLPDSYGRWDFRACVVLNLATVAADDDDWMAAWRAERPDDEHPNLIDCEALTMVAWQLRGTKLANETTSEQSAGFSRVLARAEPAATLATEAFPDDPTPWFTLVTIARGRGFDRARFDEVWRGLTDRAPLHRRGHQAALQYWCAKWYGSHEQMFTFAQHAAELTPALSLLLLRAAYEKHNDDPKVWRQQNVQDALNTFLHWLAADGADNVDVRDDLGWAALALVESGRGDEAIPIFTQLGRYAGGQPWSYHDLPTRMFEKYRIRASNAK